MMRHYVAEQESNRNGAPRSGLEAILRGTARKVHDLFKR